MAAKNAKPKDAPYKLTDEKGLYLYVKPNGSKQWCLKYGFQGKAKKLSFGSDPEVTLAQARERQFEARREVKSDVDLGEFKKQIKQAPKFATADSFEAVLREWFMKFSSEGAATHRVKVLAWLENNLFPWIGGQPISPIKPPELLAN